MDDMDSDDGGQCPSPTNVPFSALTLNLTVCNNYSLDGNHNATSDTWTVSILSVNVTKLLIVSRVTHSVPQFYV